MLLTVLTVGVSFLPLAAVWHSVIGLIIAVCKGSLVVLFFMHVLISPRLTWVVLAVAFCWLGLLFLLSLNDYLTARHDPVHAGTLTCEPDVQSEGGSL